MPLIFCQLACTQFDMILHTKKKKTAEVSMLHAETKDVNTVFY